MGTGADNFLNSIILTSKAVESMTKNVTGSRDDIMKKTSSSDSATAKSLTSVSTGKQISANEIGKGKSINVLI